VYEYYLQRWNHVLPVQDGIPNWVVPNESLMPGSKKFGLELKILIQRLTGKGSNTWKKTVLLFIFLTETFSKKLKMPMLIF